MSTLWHPCQPLSQWLSLLIFEFSSNACSMIVLVMTILSGLFLRDDELLNPNMGEKKNYQQNRMSKRINQMENLKKVMYHQEMVGP